MRRAARKTPEVGVAMLGQGFMGHTHSRAYRAIASSTWPAPLRPRLASLCGRDQAELDEKMARYRWERAVTEWRVQLEDERVQLFDNVGPNTLHLKPTIAAIHRGKHVICEKPLAPSADEAYQLWREAETAQVLHMCAFNYRFFPAIELARRMIEQGEIGDVHHFRSRFLVPSPAADARPAWRDEDPAARGGVLADVASHHLDAARFLVGEISTVLGRVVGPPSDPELLRDTPEQAVHCILTFSTGATGTLDVSRLTKTPTVDSMIEVHGSRGSLTFRLVTLNELTVTDGTGSRTIYTTHPGHPYMRFWYPLGHPLAWGDSFIHEIDHFLRAVAGELSETRYATFEDGYRCAEVCDAIRLAARDGTRVQVPYRSALQLEAPALSIASQASTSGAPDGQ